MYIKLLIAAIFTPDQSNECSDKLHYAYINAQSAEISIRFNNYSKAYDELVGVLDGASGAMELHCQPDEDIFNIYDETTALLSMLPNSNYRHKNTMEMRAESST